MKSSSNDESSDNLDIQMIIGSFSILQTKKAAHIRGNFQNAYLYVDALAFEEPEAKSSITRATIFRSKYSPLPI